MNKRQRKKHAKKKLDKLKNHPIYKIQYEINKLYHDILMNQILFGTAMIKCEWDETINEPGIKLLTYPEMLDFTIDKITK